MPSSSISMRRPRSGRGRASWAEAPAAGNTSKAAAVNANTVRGLIAPPLGIELHPYLGNYGLRAPRAEPPATCASGEGVDRRPALARIFPPASPLQHRVLAQLDVGPHRVRVRRHANPLVGAMGGSHILDSDRRSDEPQHPRCEAGVVTRVGRPDD